MTNVRAAAVLVALVITAAMAGPGPATGAAGPRGDPGGRILGELAAIRRAVPPDATDVHVQRAEPVITSSCDTTQPDAGVRIVFTSRRPVAQVQQGVAAALRRAGWTYRRTAHLRGVSGFFGRPVLADLSVMDWSRRLPSGPAGAQLQGTVPEQGWHAGQPLQWLLGATARGVHLPRRHCGQA